MACPPSDEVDEDAGRALIAESARSFLRVTRPELDLPAIHAYEGEYRHRKAAARFRALIDEGVLVEDRAPHLYLYEQRLGEHRQMGLVACVPVKDFVFGSLKGHKQVREEQIVDRMEHIEHLRAHDEPVLLGYRADADVDAIVNHAARGKPSCSFEGADGVEHSVWVLDPDSRQAVSERLAVHVRRSEAAPALYVLHGQHLCSAAIRVHQRLRGSRGEDDVFLALLVPHTQIKLAAYRRLVRDYERRGPQVLLEKLRGLLDLTAVADSSAARPRAHGSVGLYLAGQWYAGRLPEGGGSVRDPVEALDCSQCDAKVLAPLFAVPGSREEKHLEFVAGDRPTSELEAQVDSGEFVMAVRLFPPSVEQVFAVSDANRSMPRRSYSLALKPASGLFVHTF